jgi:hypothetical protein
LLTHLEPIGFLILIWFAHLIPLLVVSVPVWFFGRKRVKWNGWDFAIVVLPFAVWGALMLVSDLGKSVSNGLIIGWILPIAPIIRVVVGERMNQKKMALGLLVALCFVAGCLWGIVPQLSE